MTRRMDRPRGRGLFWSALLCVGLVPTACIQLEEFPPRTRVGIMPESFSARSVESAADAAAYVDEYTRALGVEGVRAVRSLKVEDSYWVYSTETDSDHAAFGLEVFPDGEIRLKRFPAMEPGMMWNQKYGHRARPDLDAMVENVTVAEAERRLSRSLRDDRLGLGPVLDYYGYFLFPLCDGDRFAGEGAVNADDGEVAWERLSSPPREVWSLSEEYGLPCGGT